MSHQVNFHSHALGEWWVSPALFRDSCSAPKEFSDQISSLLEKWKQERSELLDGNVNLDFSSVRL